MLANGFLVCRVANGSQTKKAKIHPYGFGDLYWIVRGNVVLGLSRGSARDYRTLPGLARPGRDSREAGRGLAQAYEYVHKGLFPTAMIPSTCIQAYVGICSHTV